MQCAVNKRKRLGIFESKPAPTTSVSQSSRLPQTASTGKNKMAPATASNKKLPSRTSPQAARTPEKGCSQPAGKQKKQGLTESHLPTGSTDCSQPAGKQKKTRTDRVSPP